MGGSSAPSVPAVTVPPPIPQVQSPAGLKAASDTAARAQNAVGPAATIGTTPNGTTAPATTGTKTLLGS
ncbi:MULTISPECIES: hypothetical protein [Ralstonia]|uniref:Uncharacterized protein n=1 Tax=Ralstonia condita TaxID=3058600 RepID=A0ABN9ID71_9RALS|nr:MULTISPECIES: hypothetical protein [Ralstonia]MBB0023644.1 hypothetical protein [Ralstonia pickettii]MBB0096997.1 hypothetical protein [Ralstonia pickettii]MBB0107033.1 hypothetical protein [Ralstonia pickettii]MBB0127770.1 hypothetical protein [Ralstonia pickettii]MBB0160733.1 hypothetical protein [Ralstonia pickettii]